MSILNPSKTSESYYNESKNITYILKWWPPHNLWFINMHMTSSESRNDPSQYSKSSSQYIQYWTKSSYILETFNFNFHWKGTSLKHGIFRPRCCSTPFFSTFLNFSNTRQCVLLSTSGTRKRLSSSHNFWSLRSNVTSQLNLYDDFHNYYKLNIYLLRNNLTGSGYSTRSLSHGDEICNFSDKLLVINSSRYDQVQILIYIFRDHLFLSGEMHS